MIAGRGWIALALVVFATWRPGRVLAGAYLFGGVTHRAVPGAGARASAIPSQLLSALPYVATILVLVLISRDARRSGSTRRPRSASRSTRRPERR